KSCLTLSPLSKSSLLPPESTDPRRIGSRLATGKNRNMSTFISPLAHVDSRAELGRDVHVGPFCVIGPEVQVGDRCRLESHVVLTRHTAIGADNRFFPNCVIGAEPQDYSYSGSPTRVEIGDANMFREGVTVNRGAEKEDHVTRIGNHNL